MKNLIVYFSWSGNIEKLVRDTNKKFGFDVERIERKIPYSSDYNTCAYVEAKEECESKSFPEISEIDVNYSNYDNILLFFPIWWYSCPRPVATFVKNLNGYKGSVYVFANSYTNDPQYMETSMKELEKVGNKLHFEKGLFNKSVKEHIDFIVKI